MFLFFSLQWGTMATTTPYTACSLCLWLTGRPFARITSRPPCPLSTCTPSCATSCPSDLFQTTAPSLTSRTCWPKSQFDPCPAPLPAPLPRSRNTPMPPSGVRSLVWCWCWAFWGSTSDKWRSNRCTRWSTKAGRCRSPYCKRTCNCRWRRRNDGRRKRRGGTAPQGSPLCSETSPEHLPYTTKRLRAAVYTGLRSRESNLTCWSRIEVHFACLSIREMSRVVLLMQA